MLKFLVICGKILLIIICLGAGNIVIDRAYQFLKERD